MFSLNQSFLSLLILDLVPAPAAESIHGGRSINKGARREMMAEKETVREDGYQRTRDMVSLVQNLVQNHVLGPDPDPDRKTINVVDLPQNHGLDPGKGEKRTHGRNNRLSPPETRGSRGQKTKGDAGLDPAQEKEEKKAHPPRVCKNLQAPLFPHLKIHKICRPRKKRRIPLEAPSKWKT